MAAIAGLRGSGDFGADERPTDFREYILWAEPNGMAPLNALMSKMGSEAASDPEFSWWEEKLQNPRLQVNGALAVGATTAVVDAEDLSAGKHGALSLVAGDVLAVESANGIWVGELLVVSANPTVDTQFTVSRGHAGSTAAAIADNAWLTRIGNVHSEGSLAPKASTRNPTKLRNYCQIFKKAYEITETTKAIKGIRTGDPLKNDKKRKLFEIMAEMEMSMLYGRAHEATGANGKPQRSTGGLLSFITTNRTEFGGGGTAWTEDNLIDFFASVFNYDAMGAGNERLAFCGNAALTSINKLARGSSSTRINFEGTVKAYGMELTKWVLPQGTYYLRTHPLFNVHPVLTKSLVAINPKGIKERPLRKLKLKENTQPRDADYESGYWIAETGLEVNFEETMAYGGNLGG